MTASSKVRNIPLSQLVLSPANVRKTPATASEDAAPPLPPASARSFVSTTSVYRPDTRYGSSKIIAELIAEDYRQHRRMNVITLRSRGFIPYWDRDVYAKYSDWARWFWKGAVHIDDVAAAVILSLDLIFRQQITQQLVLTLDSAYEYTDADLDHWDAEGPGSTFRKYYPECYDLALSYGLDPALKPTRLDISETVSWLGYKPSYSLANLLSELAAYGDSGPPRTRS